LKNRPQDFIWSIIATLAFVEMARYLSFYPFKHFKYCLALFNQRELVL